MLSSQFPPKAPAMQDDVAAVMPSLLGKDRDMIAKAWQDHSGRWYINGRCSHLYAFNPPICSLSGVLTTHGEAVRAALIASGEMGG